MKPGTRLRFRVLSQEDQDGGRSADYAVSGLVSVCYRLPDVPIRRCRPRRGSFLDKSYWFPHMDWGLGECDNSKTIWEPAVREISHLFAPHLFCLVSHVVVYIFVIDLNRCLILRSTNRTKHCEDHTELV